MRTHTSSPVDGSLRVALWAVATVVGTLFLVVASATSSSAATDDSRGGTSDVDAPVAGLLDDLTDGTTRPLTDALEPLTAPVEKAAAPVTHPLRDAVAPRTAPEEPGAARSTTAPPEVDHAEAAGTSSDTSAPLAAPSGDTDPAATTDASAADQAQDGTSSSDAVSPDARDRLDALFATATVQGPDRSVDVGDLDFGPRPLPGPDHHTTAVAGIGVMAWEIAATEHVGRDDLLLEVRRGHDTGAATQNFTRPDVSPG